MTLAVDASGTQTAVVGTEQFLDQPSTAGTYVFEVDTVNLALGDILELRIYDKIDGTNYRQVWKGTWAHPQANVGKCSPPQPVTVQGQFSLKQTAGTGRNFPWRVLRYT